AREHRGLCLSQSSLCLLRDHRFPSPRAEPIQTFRCPACHSTFSARRDTPLYRLKTPSHQVAMVLSALAEGLDSSAAARVFGYRQATPTQRPPRARQEGG